VGRNLGSFSTDRFTYGPSASLQFLLLDFGGRSGTVGEAHEALVAADYSSDATVQNTVLLAEAAFFSYNSARDLLDAQQANVVTAQENRTAAEQRFRVGLATVADTLQASTALAQAQLSLLQTEGDLQTARGNLAAAIGTSANTPFQIARDSTPAPVGAVTESVDTLIARAVQDRPDLNVARAQTASAVDAIKVARSAALPSFTFGGTAGRVVSNPSQFTGNSYAMTLGLNLPVFNGGSYEYDIQAAKALADVARAREEVTRVQIANQVFTSYAGLQTAAARVTTSAALLASAVKSEDVARGRYDEGVGTFLDLLTAQNALAAARSQAAQTRWAWYTALGQLAHDVGVLDKRGDPHLPGAMTPGPKPLPSGQR
jgi:outer membrane protein